MKSIKIRIEDIGFWIGILFLGTFVQLHADEGRTSLGALTLEEVLSSVDQSFPTMIAAKSQIRKAESEYQSALGGFDPTVKAGYTNVFYGYYQNTVTDFLIEQPTPVLGARVFAGWRQGQGGFHLYESQYATFTDGSFRGGVEIPLLKGRETDERRAKIKTTEQGISVAQFGFQAQRLDLRKQAAARYWDWIAAGRKLNVGKNLLDIALSRNEAIRKRILHGDLPAIDQSDNERSIVQRKANLAAMQRAFQKASLELSLFLRNSQGDPMLVSEVRLPQNYSNADLKVILDKTRAAFPEQWTHPELKKITAQKEQLATEYHFANNQLLPKLDLKWGIYSDFGFNPGLNYLPPSQYPTEMKAALSLEFPLFFRAARGKKEAIRSYLDILEQTQQLTYNRLEVQLRDAVQAMQTAHERLLLAQEEVTLSKKLEESEKMRAFHGDSSFLLVNLREQATQDAMLKEIEIYSDFYKYHSDYLSYRGEL